ncbi:MAG: thioredoxin [Nanoarchaeota archaeon]|nr:thioredoxin [Nanoarchaeota archaeon]
MSSIKITKSNFSKEVKESEQPVILDFLAPWCGPCQMMGPVFEGLSDDFKGKLKFGKVNTDEESELSDQFSIRGIPCLVITHKGKELDRIVGFAGKDMLKNKISAIINSR